MSLCVCVPSTVQYTSPASLADTLGTLGTAQLPGLMLQVAPLTDIIIYTHTPLGCFDIHTYLLQYCSLASVYLQYLSTYPCVPVASARGSAMYLFCRSSQHLGS